MSTTRLRVASASLPACAIEFRLSVRTDLDIKQVAILSADAGPFGMQTYLTADELEELSSMFLLASHELRELETPAEVIAELTA